MRSRGDCRADTYWPAERQAKMVVVVVGQEEASRLDDVLQAGWTTVGIPGLDFDIEQLVLEVLATGCDSVWLLLPAELEAYGFNEAVADGLLAAGQPYAAALSMLPGGWSVTDLIEEVGADRNSDALLSALWALWLAAGPPQEALKRHLRDLALEDSEIADEADRPIQG
jgi:hypothetical protein